MQAEKLKSEISDKVKHSVVKFFLHKQGLAYGKSLEKDYKNLTDIMTPGDDDVGGNCEECGNWSLVSKAPDVCPFCGTGDNEDSQAKVAAEIAVFETEIDGRKKKKEKVETVVKAEALPPKKPKKNIIAVPPTDGEPAKNEAGLVTTTSPLLNAAVERVVAYQQDLFKNYWLLADEVRKIYEDKIYLQELDDKGHPVHDWGGFCKHTLKFTARYADMLIRVAKEYTQQQVLAFGVAKLNLISAAPVEHRSELLDLAEKGASKKEIREETRKLKNKGEKQIDSVPLPKSQDKLIVLQIAEKRFEVPLYERQKQGSTKTPAVALNTHPHGEYLTANGMRLMFWVERDKKTEQLKVTVEALRQDRIDD